MRMLTGNPQQAGDDFRAALEMDPGLEKAREKLREIDEITSAVGGTARPSGKTVLVIVLAGLSLVLLLVWAGTGRESGRTAPGSSPPGEIEGPTTAIAMAPSDVVQFPASGGEVTVMIEVKLDNGEVAPATCADDTVEALTQHELWRQAVVEIERSGTGDWHVVRILE